MSYDYYETGRVPDVDTIERLTRNLGLNKAEIIEHMSKLSEVERKKSMIGRVNKEDNNISSNKG